MQPQLNNEFFKLANLSRDFKEKTRKPSEVTQFYLERIIKNDPKIGAFENFYPEAAIKVAQVADDQIAKGNWMGPFHGIPFVLKDICEVEGHITTCGSEIYKNRISTATASVAKRLMGAGGILLGKSKTVEFAFGGWGTNQRMGTPWNPWDKDNHRICGGSSAGSAAALASNMAVCAIGTDTGGSVRLPSAFCGLTGLKVAKGRLPTDGIMPLSHTLDTPGPMARSVTDMSIMFEVLLGTNGKEIEEKIKSQITEGDFSGEHGRKFRLAVINDKARRECSSQVLKHYDQVIKILQNRGAIVGTYNPKIDFAEISKRMGDIIAVEAYHHHGHLYENKANPMDEDVRQRVLKVKGYSAARYLKLLRDREESKREFLNSFERFDALITPTTTSEAPLVCNVDQAVSPGYFTRPANYFDMCALSLPMGLSKNGLPLSLQISARPVSELTAIRIGVEVERQIGSIY